MDDDWLLVVYLCGAVISLALWTYYGGRQGKGFGETMLGASILAAVWPIEIILLPLLLIYDYASAKMRAIKP